MKTYSRKQIITASIIGCVLLSVIFGHNYIYSSEQKIEQFKEDYFRYNDYYRQLVSTINSLEIEESKYQVAWNYKNNEAIFLDKNNHSIVVEPKTNEIISEIMEHDMEVVFVSDSLIKIMYRNSTNYSDLTFYATLSDFQLVTHFPNAKVYSGNSYPGRFESGWVYTLSNGTLISR